MSKAHSGLMATVGFVLFSTTLPFKFLRRRRQLWMVRNTGVSWLRNGLEKKIGGKFLPLIR
jgi:hypothetical protein